jgi:hypothetical protein
MAPMLGPESQASALYQALSIRALTDTAWVEGLALPPQALGSVETPPGNCRQASLTCRCLVGQEGPPYHHSE